MEYIDTQKLGDEQFVNNFESRVKETISNFKLFDSKEKLLVAASGGKDSTVLLYLLKKFGYDVEAITINAHIGCYSDESLEHLKNFCSKEKIKLNIVELKEEFGHTLCEIMALMDSKGFNKTSCSICGTLRRYLLNKHGKKLNSKILLTGHNLDDESEGMMMALFNGNPKQVARIGPLTFGNSDVFVKRGKPLYFIFEDEVERYSKIKKFEVHYGWCPCSVKASRRFYSELGVVPEKKFNLVKNIVSELPKLRVYFKESKLSTCSVCEQPSSNNLCQTCTILSTIKDEKINETIMNEAKRLEAEHNTCSVPLIQIK